MLKFVLYVVLGTYLVNLLVVLGKFAFHWSRAVWSKSVWFNMALAGPQGQGDQLYFGLNLVPWFYDERLRHFTFAFGLRGFQFYFIPYKQIAEILISEFNTLQSWQVLYDSARIPLTKVDLSHSTPRGLGFSLENDLIFFTESEIDTERIDRFANEVGKDLVEDVRQIFNPPAFIVKLGNSWTIGYKDPEIGRRIITRFFEEVGRKVLVKNQIDGDVSIGSGDAADRFIARGQIRWWIKGSLLEDSIVIEGEGFRPGEFTSADWALVTMPIEA